MTRPPSPRPHDARGAGRVLVLLAAVLWGTTGTAAALAPAGVTPVAIGAVRIVGGGTLLALWAWRRNLLGAGRPWPVAPVAIGAVAVAAYQLCFFSAVDRTGVALGTVVAIGSAPVAAGLLGRIIEGERLSRAWMTATLLSVTGCVGLVAGAGEIRVDPVGVILAVGAGMSYACYAVASKRLLGERPPTAVMAVLFGGAAVLLLPLLTMAPLAWLLTARGLSVAAHLALVTTAFSYVLFARGLQRTTVAAAATLSLAEPLTAAALGVGLLGERLSVLQVLGAAVLLAGLALLALPRRYPIRPGSSVRRRGAGAWSPTRRSE